MDSGVNKGQKHEQGLGETLTKQSNMFSFRIITKDLASVSKVGSGSAHTISTHYYVEV